MKLFKSFLEESDDQKILKYLKKVFNGEGVNAQIVDDELLIEKFHMGIKTWISDKIQHPNAIVVEMNFIISQQEFDEKIVETLAGIGQGSDIEEAIKNGVVSFKEGVLNAIFNSFDEVHNPKLDFETVGETTRLWHPKPGVLQLQGYVDESSIDENRIFNILKDDIKVRLGDSRFYWIKVYVSRQASGKVIIQCTLNNEPFYAAEEKLIKYAEGWNTKGQFKVEKQYIIVRQCDKTWRFNKYADIDFIELVNKSIDIMIESNYDNFLDKTTSEIGDDNLAFELCSFIPELYCRILFREVKYSDEVIIERLDGTRKIMYLSQFYVFNKIKNIVYRRIQSEADREKVKKILAFSASFNAINKALFDGSRLEDLAVGPIVLVK